MFANRIVTKAVKKNCLFCDACMKMIDDDEDFVVQSFAVLQGKKYTGREVESKERYIVCRHCFEQISGSYQIHKDMIEAGSEGCFQRDGITEAEIRALLQMKPEKKDSDELPKPVSFVQRLQRKDFLSRRI